MPSDDATQFQAKLSSVFSNLAFRSLNATEEISRPFEFIIGATSDKEDLSANDILGTAVDVTLTLPDGTERHFCGVVVSFGIDGIDGRGFSYRLVARPQSWLLTRAANVRVYQNQSAVDIVSDVFQRQNMTVKRDLDASYNERVYCVQYRESDFNFVNRLLEEEGISYYYTQSANQHEMVLVDSKGGFSRAGDCPKVNYLEGTAAETGSGVVRTWQMKHEIQTDKYQISDFNFTTPDTDLASDVADSGRSHAEAGRQVYDYPGLHEVKGDGDSRAVIRQEEATSRFARFVGSGDSMLLSAGGTFELANHPRDDQNGNYLLVKTTVHVTQAGYEAGSSDTTFECTFEAAPLDQPFRPARITPKPAVAGPQTATVVGSSSDGDIVTDEYGRVKVQLHWQTPDQRESGGTCWVRVASPLAGDGWGFISLPRVGQEVVVDFLEGDPDQPIITGRVYNATQVVPYPLPDNATVSTFKSRSKQGGANDFNELRFEDKAGSEYVLLQAQKDRLEFVEETLRTQIGKDAHHTITGDFKEKVGGEQHLGVAKDVKQKIGGKYSLKVAQDLLVQTDANYGLKSATKLSVKSGDKLSLQTATEMHAKAGTNLGVEAGVNVHIKAGVGWVLESGATITIKAGASSIVLGPDGVSITGAMVKVNSGGSPGSGAGASPVDPDAPDAPDDPDAPQDPLSHR